MRYQGVIPHHVIAVGEEQPHSNMTWQLQKVASENDVIFLCDANLFLVSVLWRSDDGLTTTTSDGGVSRFPVILNPSYKCGFPVLLRGLEKKDMSVMSANYVRNCRGEEAENATVLPFHWQIRLHDALRRVERRMAFLRS